MHLLHSNIFETLRHWSSELKEHVQQEFEKFDDEWFNRIAKAGKNYRLKKKSPV